MQPDNAHYACRLGEAYLADNNFTEAIANLEKSTMLDPKLLSHLQKDTYINLIGATMEAVEPGYCRVSIRVSESMLNFHGTTHGGIVFGIAGLLLVGLAVLIERRREKVRELSAEVRARLETWE